MARHRPPTGIERRPRRRSGEPYVLISRGLNGRLRFERFDDVDAYRRRLTQIDGTSVQAISIDDIVGLLE